ncbi:hypothetical protein FGRMN_137 [Fusarium graminum]|nr:hypothetical protein FGRMN_137 [Fusarium graminum]
MRSQHHSSVSIPIPRHIPPKAVLDHLQTYEPVLRCHSGIVSWQHSVPDYSSVVNDSFFDGADPDHSLRAYQVYEVIRLGPGVGRDLRWPIIFQKVPNGIVSRSNAPAGVISWVQWYVRQRQGEPAESVSTPNTATPPSCGDDEWELYGLVTLEAHRMLMPWVTPNSNNYQVSIAQGIVDEACANYESAEVSTK